jgi:hypothetical protein
MSITESESAAPAKFSARQHQIKFLRDKLAFVSDDASTAELIRQARAFGSSDSGDAVVAVGNAFISRRSGSTDPLIEHWINRAQQEEQYAREQRHDKQQPQVEQRIEQHIEQQAAQATQEQLNIWWDNKLTLAMSIDDETSRHPIFAGLIDSIAEVNVEHDKALRREIDNAKKYTHELVGASLKE